MITPSSGDRASPPCNGICVRGDRRVVPTLSPDPIRHAKPSDPASSHASLFRWGCPAKRRDSDPTPQMIDERRRHTAGLVGMIGAVAFGSIIPLRQRWQTVQSATPVPAPWPTALHDARHSGTLAVVGPQSGRVMWSRQLGGSLTPGPVIGSDGTIYIATNSGVLHAVDPANGMDRWTLNGGGPFTGETDLSVSPLILPSGSLLLACAQQRARRGLGFGHGDLVPSVLRRGAVARSLRVEHEYVVSMDGTVSALRMGGRQPIIAWSLALGSRSFGSPVLMAPVSRSRQVEQWWPSPTIGPMDRSHGDTPSAPSLRCRRRRTPREMCS